MQRVVKSGTIPTSESLGLQPARASIVSRHNFFVSPGLLAAFDILGFGRRRIYWGLRETVSC